MQYVRVVINTNCSSFLWSLISFIINKISVKFRSLFFFKKSRISWSYLSSFSHTPAHIHAYFLKICGAAFSFFLFFLSFSFFSSLYPRYFISSSAFAGSTLRIPDRSCALLYKGFIVTYFYNDTLFLLFLFYVYIYSR